MQVGASFNVMITNSVGGGGIPAQQLATSANSSGDSTYISNSDTDGNPNAVVFDTPSWNTATCACSFDPAPTGIWWSSGADQAAVFNEDESAIPLDTAFSLIIYQS
jgi:hypothetical protein